MPPKRRRTDGQRTWPPGAGGDRLGALPDDVLHLVLSHLTAEDAVRTCVLARRWLHLWKSATGLHIQRRMQNLESAKAAREFVDHLLLLRGGTPLDTVELRLKDVDEKVEDDMARIRLWIRHIMACRVRVLTLEVDLYDDEWAKLRGLAFTSNHLRELHLFGINCEDELLDFSCCPALEILETHYCDFAFADTISSPSLRCLRIHGTCAFHSDARTQIYAPNLRSLRLTLECNRDPVLARMPFLMEAFVEISCDSTDFCYYSISGYCENDYCEGCNGMEGNGVEGDTDNCVLLQGLSEARNLALISDIDIFTFRRDLKWCPEFGNLKTLLLNEYWCEPADFSALAYMLEHSPVLEKLTLELDCKWRKSEAQVLKGIPDPTERSDTMSEHLKMVEVKCKVVNDKVVDVLKFFGKLGICFRFLSN